MGIWASIKNKLRRIVPVPRTYLDKKLGDMEKENKRQSKVIGDLQKASLAQTKAIEELKAFIEQEFRRRDDWPVRNAQLHTEAAGRPLWVIKCPAPEGPVKVRWGDYAYAVTLKRYLDRLGVYTVVDTREDWGCEEDADVVLVLRGCHFYRPDRRNARCLYIMWNISHPEMITPEEYELYDVVCVSSNYYAKCLQEKVTVPVLPLLQCTDTELFYPAEESGDDQSAVQAKGDYIFIGNSRGVARRCVIWSAQNQLPLKIWGSGWKAMLGQNKGMVQDTSIENSQIPDLYRSAKATLNDHWKDMLDYQFVNNRIFDALACGLPVISDYCEELKEIFPDAVLYYNNKEEFDDCIMQLETHYDEIKEKVAKQWPLIREQYSFEARARELLKIEEKYRHTKTAKQQGEL